MSPMELAEEERILNNVSVYKNKKEEEEEEKIVNNMLSFLNSRKPCHKRCESLQIIIMQLKNFVANLDSKIKKLTLIHLGPSISIW